MNPLAQPAPSGNSGLDSWLFLLWKRITGVTNVAPTIATPAGGSSDAVLLMGTTTGFGIYYGSGAPTVSAAAGSLYIRTDNAGASLRLYSNTTGSTVWAAITSA